MKRTTRWTADDLARAAAMRKDGMENSEIAEKFGITRSAATSLCKRAYNREYMKEYQRKERVPRPPRRDPNSRTVKNVALTDAAMADRDRRASAPRSLTAILLGDPPPGCSALDEKGLGQSR